MKRLEFTGYSDDTFGEYRSFNIDEDNCANGKPICFKVTNEKDFETTEGMYVYGWYNGKDMPSETPGCWMVGVQNLFDDMPLPDWKIFFQNVGCDYSPTLVIEAPDSVNVEIVKAMK